MTVPDPAGAAEAPVPGDVLVIATFNDENVAAEALKAMNQAAAEQNWTVHATAVVRREDDGAISIKENNDVTMGSAAATGGVLGGLLGLIFRSPIKGAAAGALLGAGASKLVDAGINDARLRQIGDALPNGSSAVAAIVGAASQAAVKEVLEAQGAATVSEPVVGGATVALPRTGNAQIDSFLQSAEEAVQPYADQSADVMTRTTQKVEETGRKLTGRAEES